MEVLNFTFTVFYLNHAPVISQLQHSLPSVIEDVVSSDNPGAQVGSLASIVASDMDDPVLGLAVISSDQANGIWQYRQSGSSVWVPFPNRISLNSALLLSNDDWVRFSPNDHYFGSSQFFAHAWDMSGNMTDIESADPYSGPFSYDSLVFSIAVTHVNDPPQIDLSVISIMYTENAPPLQIFQGNLNITDVDNVDLSSATVILERPNCEDTFLDFQLGSGFASSGMSHTPSSSDMIISLHAAPMFDVRIVSLASLYTELLISPLPSADSSIAAFTRYLQSLHYANTDQEPSDAPRYVTLFVHDGINSSNAAQVQINITPVNDETPSVTLPYSVFTYVEDSDAVLLFTSNVTITDLDDNNLFLLSEATVHLEDADLQFESLMVDCTFVPMLTCTFSNDTLTISGSASVSIYEVVLSNVVYENTADESTDNPRRVSIIVTDGMFSSIPVELTIEIELINDQLPVLSPSISSVIFTEMNPTSPPVRIAPNVMIFDPDRGRFPVSSLQVQLLDPENPGEEGIGLPPRDRMQLPPFVVQNFSDPLNMVFTLAPNAVGMNNMTLSGLPLRVVQNIIRNLRYINRAVQPAGNNRTVEITVYDDLAVYGVQPSQPAVIEINFVLEDDLPEVELNSFLVMYFEGQNPQEVFVAPDAVVIDVDNMEISGLHIELFPNNASIDTSQEVIRVQLPNNGSIYENSSSLSSPQTIDLIGVAMVNTYTDVLRTLTYEHTVTFGDPDSGTRVIQATPIDTAGQLGVVDEVRIAFSTTDNPPVLDLNGQFSGRNYTTVYIEEGDPVYLVSENITFFDVDTPGLTSVEITLLSGSGDTEGIMVDNSSIPSSIDKQQNDPYSIVLTGQPLAPAEDFVDILLTLQYVNGEDEPTIGTRMIQITASDGNEVSDAFSFVDIDLQNDPPIVFINGGDTQYLTTFAEEGSAVFIAPNSQVIDPDSLLTELRIVPVVSFLGDEISASVPLYFDNAMGYYVANFSATSASDIESSLSSVTFQNRLSEPPAGDRIYCLSVVDEEGFESNDICTTVTVVFMNDNTPLFNQPTYFGQILENVATTFVLQVVASDEDSINTPTLLVYSIVDGDDCMTSSSGGGLLTPGMPVITTLPCRFMIDNTTGRVMTTDMPPDREERDSYFLTLSVSDGVRDSHTNVNINILDQDDVAPVFDPDFYSVTIPLGAQVNFTIAELNVEDPDLGSVTVFQFTMNPPVPIKLFAIDAATNRVFLAVPENQLPSNIPQYNITFEAIDSGFMSSPTMATIQVNVILNDADPVFDEQVYLVSIVENSNSNVSILRVQATDADSGSNSEIRYSISQQNSPISIDELTGEVTLISMLDFEMTRQYNITVVASDQGRPVRSGSTQIVIDVENINEFSPSFTQMRYTASVCESSPVGYEILQVEAIDGDADILGEVTYWISAEENCRGCLSLDPSTGVVSVARQLNYEELFMNFRIFVQATDGGGRFSNEADVEIAVLNDNEYPPEFQFKILNLRIPENYPVGNPLPIEANYQPLALDMDACDVDMCDASVVISNVSCSSTSGLLYDIVGGNEDGLFQIYPTTGAISLSSALDFDIDQHRFFELELSVSDGEFNSTAVVQISITDSNDNLPMFENASYAITIPEDTAIGSEILTITASDIDPTSRVRYFLTGLFAEDFDINITTGVITVAEGLDFEVFQVYELTVIAVDMDSLQSPPPELIGDNVTAVSLEISLIDVNDFVPRFEEPEYTFSISENEGPSLLGVVQAIDLDSGLGSILQYSISNVNPGNTTLFSLDLETGELSSAVVFDREEYSQYVLEIEAQDGGVPSLTGSAVVVIELTDQNDNTPRLSQDMYFMNVSENVPLGFEVLALSAFDPDDLDNSALNFTFLSGNDLGHFSIQEDSGVITVRGVLDRENIEDYTLVVQVSDSGSPPRSSSGTVLVTITDEEDNPPVFDRDEYMAEINENSPNDTFVLQVQATDSDIGLNAVTRYRFVIMEAPYAFQIDSESGVVTIANSQLLDREITQAFVLTIEAFNPYNPEGLSSSVNLNVILIDENDEAPVFDQETFSVTVNEDFTPTDMEQGIETPELDSSGIDNLIPTSGMGPTQTARFITQVTAFDADEPNSPNSRFQYSLVAREGSQNFAINPENGQIFTIQPLDRESVDSYELTVQATDFGSPPQTSFAEVVINIRDLNDNIPDFSQDTYTISVVEDIPVQSEILQVQATDADIGTNSDLRFSTPDQSVPFVVDSITGQIRSSMTLDREAVPFYQFSVIVTDRGMPSLSSVTTVEFTLIDANDNPPIISPQAFSVVLQENTAIGTTIAVFSVEDIDEDINAISNISLSGQSSSFTIDNFGVLRVSGSLDYETNPVVVFFVNARNVESPHFTDVAEVNIQLINLNDNPPVVMFGVPQITYFERLVQLTLDVQAFIVDDDGRNVTRIVDGIVEFNNPNPLEPSAPFTPNTDGLYLPYDCPLEVTKDRKFGSCGAPVAEDHVITRPQFEGMENLDEEDISDDTILFDASRQQYAYQTISTSFGSTGLTIATWIWVAPVSPAATMTIISKSATSLLYSLYCTAELDLGFQYRNTQNNERSVLFVGGCAQLQNSWHHLAVVLDNSDPSQWAVAVYIDADLYQTQPIETPMDVAGRIFVGTRTTAGVNTARREFFNGRLHMLILSYTVADRNSINCAIGCGVALFSTLEDTPIASYYNFTRRALIFYGTQSVETYEEFLNSLRLSLPLREPVSSSYSVSYTVQDEFFNCLPTFITISLQPVNDHQPVLTLSGAIPPQGDINYSTDFIEEGGPVPVVNRAGLSLTDGDLVAFTYTITVAIVDAQPPGSVEVLEVQMVPEGMNSTYDRDNYILTLTGDLPLPMFETVVRTMTYNNLDDEPEGTSRQLLFTVSDPPESDVTAITTIQFIPVNDLADVRVSFRTTEYNEGDGPVLVLENSVIEDSDNTTLVFASVSLNALDGNLELLSVNTTGTDIQATYNSSTNVLSLSGMDTLENYAAVLESLTYEHTSLTDPTSGTRSLTFVVFDGIDESQPEEVPLFFTAVNDPPVLDLNGPTAGFNFEATFIEDQVTSVQIVSPDSQLIDVDNMTIASVNVTLSPVLDIGQETILLTDGGTTYSDTEFFITTTRGPGKVSTFLRALHTLRYQNLAEEPTGGVRTITFIANDGISDSETVISTITVQTVNDLPVLDINVLDPEPGYQTLFVENGPPVFITSPNVSISDNDAGANISTVMVVIQRAFDFLDESIESTDPNIVVTPFTSSQSRSFTITPVDGSLEAVEDILSTLTYINRRDEPTIEDRVITISVSDGIAFSNSELVVIQLESVNQHPPQFVQPSYSRSVIEEMAPNTNVVTVAAVDLDGDLDGSVTYEIVGSDPSEGALRFRIDNLGTVYTTEPLDREMVDVYTLNVSAADGGMPQRVDFATVFVSVLDINDQSPVFQPNTDFNLTILESRPIGFTIDTVEATDADIGTNAIVIYELGPGVSSPFDVQSDGQIVVSQGLDADSGTTVFTISIIARDNGSQPLSTEAQFTITVLDVNDNPPQFTPEPNYNGTLRENLPSGTSILSVSAVDIDSGSYAEVSFSFADSQTNDVFSIDPNTGEISSSIPLDRESINSYSFTVVATDNGTPSLSSTAEVNILVTDENDIAPVFSQTRYTGMVSENAAMGTSVLQVLASDGDEGLNADLFYRIVPNSALMPLFASGPLFYIDQMTGDIFVNESADFELQNVVQFTVEAQDFGTPPLVGRATVSVAIVDENDNSPVFAEMIYQVSVDENEAELPVITVFADDADSNENGRITYSLLNDFGLFAIDPDTGAISTAATLDFETVCFHRIVGIASDNGTPSHNTMVLVEVTVLPVHDVPPMFSPASYTGSVGENLPPGSFVAQVTALDGDETTCEELVDPGTSGSGFSDITIGPTQVDLGYYLLNHEDIFDIDMATGVITTLVELDRETVAQYTLNVQARDPANLIGDAIVTVNVLDKNDNFPRFLQPSYTIAVPENSDVGTPVIQVIASDPDFLDQGRLVYRLRDQQAFFEINSQSGVISVSQSIDFESVGTSIEFTAVVTDSASKEAAALVRVIVTDINDRAPSIDTTPQTFTFLEGSVSLLPFPDVSISDPDMSQTLCNATITLTTPQLLNQTSDCVCSNSSDPASCTQGCLEFIQLPPGVFPGVVTQTSSATVLSLEGAFLNDIYEPAIESVEYVNVISNPLPDTRTISLSVFDCQRYSSNTLEQTIIVRPLNRFPPVVDLNGQDVGEDFSTMVAERRGPVSIASSNATIIDSDVVNVMEELTSLEIFITNAQDGNSEFLFHPEPFNYSSIVLTGNASQSISFAGRASLDDYVNILVNVLYINTETEPDSTSRLISVGAHQFSLSSNVSTTTITFITSNDHPPVILTSPPLENSVVVFREATSGVLLTARDAAISDADSTPEPITELQVNILAPTEYDRVFLQAGFNLPNPISMDQISTSSLVLRGMATQAEYESVLRSLTYQYTGDEFETLFPPKFIYLQVADSMYSSFSAVQVALEPVNDQMPVFTEDAFNAEVPENATVGYEVIQVTAVDNDRFSDSNMQYSILAGNDDGLFAISELDGKITLNRTLDFEMDPLHRLIVQVRDLEYVGSSSVSMDPNTAVVSIMVGDVNDHVPMFNMSEYNVTVGEGVPIGTSVLRVSASDRDSDVHSELQFAIFGTTDFGIDPQTGVVFTLVEIDRETTSFYSLFVSVSNPGISAFDVARVNITVLDLDDNPPVLILQPTATILREPETVVPLATALQIIDQDPSPSLDYALAQILPPSPGLLLATIQSNSITLVGNGTARLEFRGESRPLGEYVEVLRGVVYQDASEEPLGVDRVIAYQIGSSVIMNEPVELQYTPNDVVSNVSEFFVTVELLNDNQPQLLLDTRDQSTVLVLPQCMGVVGSYSINFNEDSSPVLLSHSSLSITDADSGENVITYAFVEISDAQDIGFERLSVQASENITVSAENSDVRLVLMGPASLEEFTAVLQTIRYDIYTIYIYHN